MQSASRGLVPLRTSRRPEREESFLPQAVKLAPDLGVEATRSFCERVQASHFVRGLQQRKGGSRYRSVRPLRIIQIYFVYDLLCSGRCHSVAFGEPGEWPESDDQAAERQ